MITTGFLMILMSVMFAMFLSKSDKVEQLENKLKLQQSQTDSLTHKIDSLKSEIDTLQWDRDIWDYNKYESIDTTVIHWPWGREEFYYFKYKDTADWTDTPQGELLSSIIHVESRGNDSAYNASEDAVGCLQIRQCMVNDVNRILKRQGKTKRFYYEDRWCRIKSVEIFNIVCKYYGWNTAEEIARCWNGGPRGMNYQSTSAYWKKVQKNLGS